MDLFVMKIAGFAIEVQALFETTRFYCREYLTDCEPEYFVPISRELILREQELLDLEADEEGLKRRKFTEPFLERSAIQRRVAELLADRNVLLMHGSTVAVDGQAYLFTAACGTGKSTHTRFWREAFGERAVMVNDDKPFLRFEEGTVFAYGSPWSGKHGLASPVRFPLKGICVLSRGAENVIRRAAPADVIDLLRHQCFVPEGDSMVPKLVEELSELVALWEMTCTKDPSAALISFEAMHGDSL